MKKIMVLIVDDERAARNEIRRLLANYPDFEITGEAANADDALKIINDQNIFYSIFYENHLVF